MSSWGEKIKNEIGWQILPIIRWTVTATARLTSTSFSPWWPRSWRRPTSRRTSGRPSGSLTRTVAGMYYITVLLIAIMLLLCFCPSFFLVLQSKESRQIYSPLSLCGAYWAWNEYSEYFEKRTSAEFRAGREVDEFCIKPSTIKFLSFENIFPFLGIVKLWQETPSWLWDIFVKTRLKKSRKVRKLCSWLIAIMAKSCASWFSSLHGFWAWQLLFFNSLRPSWFILLDKCWRQENTIFEPEAQWLMALQDNLNHGAEAHHDQPGGEAQGLGDRWDD